VAGYNGYSKSNNAVVAEFDGRYPITKAVKIVANETGITQREAREILKEHFDSGEFHHTSKYYNCTNYYDTGAAIRCIDFARQLNLDLTDLFFRTCRAYGLPGEDDINDFFESDYNDSTIAEFIEDIKNEVW